MTGLEDVGKIGQESAERALQSFGALSRGFQALAVEGADYSKRSVEEGAAALERLMAAGTLDKAVEVQADYVRQAYAGLVGQVGKLNEIGIGIARDAFRPFENGAVAAKRR